MSSGKHCDASITRPTIFRDGHPWKTWLTVDTTAAPLTMATADIRSMTLFGLILSVVTVASKRRKEEIACRTLLPRYIYLITHEARMAALDCFTR